MGRLNEKPHTDDPQPGCSKWAVKQTAMGEPLFKLDVRESEDKQQNGNGSMIWKQPTQCGEQTWVKNWLKKIHNQDAGNKWIRKETIIEKPKLNVNDKESGTIDHSENRNTIEVQHKQNDIRLNKKPNTNKTEKKRKIEDGNTNGKKMKNANLEPHEQQKIEINIVRGGFENKIEDDKIEIPYEIKTILSFGNKFIIPYNKYKIKDILTMIDDTERIFDETPISLKNKNILRWKEEIFKEMNQTKLKYNVEQREILKMLEVLTKFIEENKQLTIQKADKGKKTILIEKQKFIRMKEIFMQSALLKGIYKLVDKADEKQIK